MLAQIITENGVKKLKPLTADAGAGVPVGFIAPFYKKGNYSGWLYCDGSTFDATQYPLLYAYLGTNVLPDLRELGLKGAEKNTTYIFDSTETDPRTGQAGTQNHDVFAQGEFKDDQLKSHRHAIGIYARQGSAGASTRPSLQAGGDGYGLAWQDMQTSTSEGGTVTRGKSFGVFYYIKATSGLTEGQQDDVANIINGQRSYSTEEHLTGRKWTDGRPTYERTFEYTNKSITGGTWLSVDAQFPISHTDIVKGESLFICTQFSISLDWFIEGSELKVFEDMASRTGTVLLTLEYTKTT